jgi:hypothetical protein
MKFCYKWLIATLAGAATMFVWGGVSHMALLKGIGFTRMSTEERIVSTLRASLPGDGLYFFLSIDLRGNPTGEEKAAWEAKFRVALAVISVELEVWAGNLGGQVRNTEVRAGLSK